MTTSVLSIGARNLYGNVAAGCFLLALGLARAVEPSSPAVLACAVALLVLSGINLHACLSRRRERNDEMADHDSRRAASLTLWVMLAAVGVACAFGMAFGVEVELGSASCLVIGAALVIFGLSFAWLERKG